MSQPERVVYTIGHSTHPIEVFIAMLRSFDIRLLVDIRGLPGSNKYPQYNQEALQASLPASGIAYLGCTAIRTTRAGATPPSAPMRIIWRPMTLLAA